MSTLFESAKKLRPWLVSTRRDLHQRPELSLHEKSTANRCAEELEKLGLKVTRNIWGEGFIADLDGGGQATLQSWGLSIDGQPLGVPEPEVGGFLLLSLLVWSGFGHSRKGGSCLAQSGGREGP